MCARNVHVRIRGGVASDELDKVCCPVCIIMCTSGSLLGKFFFMRDKIVKLTGVYDPFQQKKGYNLETKVSAWLVEIRQEACKHAHLVGYRIGVQGHGH